MGHKFDFSAHWMIRLIECSHKRYHQLLKLCSCMQQNIQLETLNKIRQFESASKIQAIQQ